WTHGSLSGLTTNTGGRYGQASDASVAFDAKHNVWLISSLGIRSGAVEVVTSRSTDGGTTWSNPVLTAPGSNDKNWIVCDNHTGWVASRWSGPTVRSLCRTSRTAGRSARSVPPTAVPVGAPASWYRRSATTPTPVAYAQERCPRPRSTPP